MADLKQWNMRSGSQAYAVAYGNGSDPVFPVSQLGDVVSLSAVALAKDGSPWFASSFFYGPVPSVPSPGSGRGLAHDTGNARFTYVSPFGAGMSEQDVQDMVGLPDGRLVLAGAHTGLVFWDPASGAKTALRAGQGIPDDGVWQLHSPIPKPASRARWSARCDGVVRRDADVLRASSTVRTSICPSVVAPTGGSCTSQPSWRKWSATMCR